MAVCLPSYTSHAFLHTVQRLKATHTPLHNSDLLWTAQNMACLALCPDHELLQLQRLFPTSYQWTSLECSSLFSSCASCPSTCSLTGAWVFLGYFLAVSITRLVKRDLWGGENLFPKSSVLEVSGKVHRLQQDLKSWNQGWACFFHGGGGWVVFASWNHTFFKKQNLSLYLLALQRTLEKWKGVGCKEAA